MTTKPTRDQLDRLEELRSTLQFHNYRYHVLDSPVVSDYEYDQLMKELVDLETEFPDLSTPDSPSQRTGGPPAEGFERVPHPAPILSLANAFDDDGVHAWIARIGKLDEAAWTADFVIEPKIDGLAVALTW